MSTENTEFLRAVKIPVRSALALHLAKPFRWIGAIGGKLEDYAMTVPSTPTERAAMTCNCGDCIAYIRASAFHGRFPS